MAQVASKRYFQQTSEATATILCVVDKFAHLFDPYRKYHRQAKPLKIGDRIFSIMCPKRIISPSGEQVKRYSTRELSARRRRSVTIGTSVYTCKGSGAISLDLNYGDGGKCSGFYRIFKERRRFRLLTFTLP